MITPDPSSFVFLDADDEDLDHEDTLDDPSYFDDPDPEDSCFSDDNWACGTLDPET